MALHCMMRYSDSSTLTTMPACARAPAEQPYTALQLADSNIVAHVDLRTTHCDHFLPPAGSVVGERLTVAGLSGEPLNANAVKKRKAWETLAPSLTIDAHSTACFKGQPISTSAGVCTADTVTDGRIS
eukprot:4816-Heterococcus_DN1.PRE.6